MRVICNDCPYAFDAADIVQAAAALAAHQTETGHVVFYVPLPEGA